MSVPTDVLICDLQYLGFTSKVPKNEHSILGGSDERLDDAPLGYYRFHYWINSDTSKPHDNYIFMGKHSGFICISLLEENEHQFRVLIRSVLGWKYAIVRTNELVFDTKSSIRTIVLKEAMQRFCNCLTSNSDNFQIASPLNMASIGVNLDESKIESYSSVSRNSSLNSIRSNYSLSAMRSSCLGSHDSLSFSRFGSMASLTEYPNEELEGNDLDSDQIDNIIDDLNNNFFKSAYKVKDKEFPSTILELEKTLSPRSFNFDVVSLSKDQNVEYKKFLDILGEEVCRKETLNYISILTEKFKASDVVSPIASNNHELSYQTSEKTDTSSSIKLDFIVMEFIETELNYLTQLKLIDKIFISHLLKDDSGKFLLKMKDFKDVFEGITDYIPIHEELTNNIRKAQGIKGLMAALEELVRTKGLYSYQSYFTAYEKRISALKNCIKNYPKFAQFHENCVNNVKELDKKGLDQLFITPIQRMPRYVLLLKEISKYVTDSADKERMKNILDEICKTVQFLNTSKHKSEQTEMLFMMQRKVNNFPPDFLRADRMFLTKIACFPIDHNSGKSLKNRLTVYLCNDMLVFAMKRPSISGIITHDFILATDIKFAQVTLTRGKKAERSYFTIEMDKEHTIYSPNTFDLDIFFSIRTSQNNDESMTISSNFQFLPKNQKKLSAFVNEFTETKNQLLLAESPAKLLFKKEDSKEEYFHVFDRKDFTACRSRSQILILYIESEVDLKTFSDYISQYTCIVLVQARLGTFRSMVLTKSKQFLLSDEEFFGLDGHFMNFSKFAYYLHRALINSHLTVSLYPPFSRNILQQKRFILERAVVTSKSGNISAIKKGSGIRNFFSALTGGGERKQSDRLSRGSSLKNSPLSSPIKQSDAKGIEELKKEIKMESSMSLLHL